MASDQVRRAKLEQTRRPVALVHVGMYVYANPAFLRLLGYESFHELEGIPVLDMVLERHRDRLRDHFSEVESGSHSESPGSQPKTRITLIRRDGSQLVALITSRRSSYSGEETLEISLQTRNDTSVQRIFLDLPWKLYASLAFLFLMMVIPSALLLKLNINNAPKVYLPGDAPSVQVDDRLRELFPSDQLMVLLFEGVALYSDGFLEAFHALAETIKADPQIDDVVNVTNQDHISGTEDGFIVAPLIDIAALDESRPEQRRIRVLGDRFADRSLVAADGTALAMLVIPEIIEDSVQLMAMEDRILAQVAAARLDGYLVARAGHVTTDVAQLRSMLRDNMIFIPATVTVGLFLLWWLFRRLLAVIVGGTAIGVVINTTVAFYVVFDQPFNLISSIIPPLLSALTVAALVHLYNAMQLASSRGFTGQKRVDWALREIRRPAFFTALTTVAGLASLGLSPIPPIRNFGLISAAGVAMIYVIVILAVPNILARYDYARWPSSKTGLGGMDRLVRGLLHLGVRRPVPVLASALLLLAATLPQVRHIEVETNFQEFFYPDHEVRQATDYVDRKLVGTTSLDVAFSSEQEGGLKVPERLAQIRAFQQWVEALPEVDKSISHADFVEEMNWGFNTEDPRFRRIPDNPKLISQYLFVYDGNDLHDFIDQGYQFSHVSLNLNVHSANDISRVMEQVRDYLKRHVGDEMEWDIAGFGRLFADQEDLLVKGQVYSLGGALLIIFLLMLIEWRSVGGAVLCMIPNLSPILLIFIVMGAGGIWLDMATAMIASVAVGIAVDDTIHVYHGFISRVRKGISPVTAIARTYRQAGRAVVTTTLILCAQFLILITSQFVPTTHFGLLTSMGLVAALLFDLLLLPAILILIYRRQYRPRKPLEI